MLQEIIDNFLDNLEINNSNFIEKIFLIKIFICYSNDPGKQLIMYFQNNYFDESCIEINNYDNYLYTSKLTRKITLFGNINDIIHKLVSNELNYFSDKSNNNNNNFLINISNSIPNLNNSYQFEFSKDTNSTFNSCPICYTDYNVNAKIKLKCDHFICNKCFIEIIKTGTYKCPLCREPFT